MDLRNDTTTLTNDIMPAAEIPVRAAKIHVLALTPLKEKLGEKWPRLSELVHKLFESSVARVQGPADGFIALDELSYALVFRDMSLEDTNRVCEAIAKSVCQALFGDQIDEVSVRSVVAAILAPGDTSTLAAGCAIEAQLEREGSESIVSQSVHSGATDPVVTVRCHQLRPLPPILETIKTAEDLLAELGLKAGFLPAWDLTRRASSSVFLAPLVGTIDQVGASGLTLLAGLESRHVADVEIALLHAAAAYAQHLFDSRQICAVGTSVSYDTLSGFQSRIRFITALQTVRACLPIR